jgi:hypothetical protein
VHRRQPHGRRMLLRRSPAGRRAAGCPGASPPARTSLERPPASAKRSGQGREQRASRQPGRGARLGALCLEVG